MKFYDKKTHPHTLNFGLFMIGTMCGERWYWLNSWKNYPLFWADKKFKGFGIGPILFWDGS